MTFATFIRSAAIAFAVVLGAGTALAGSEVPAPGQSPKIDAIKQRGVLKAAAIGEFPWLPENTSGSGPQFSGPAWVLAEEYAKRLGVKLEIVPVSHETKVPILATGEADISIAPLSVTPKRQEVVGFRGLLAFEPVHVRARRQSQAQGCQDRRRFEPRGHHHRLFHRHAARDLGTDPLSKGEAQGRSRARAPMRRSRRSWPSGPTSPASTTSPGRSSRSRCRG